MDETIILLHAKLRNFETEARRVLAGHETSHDRVITLQKTQSLLLGLTLTQEEVFSESIECVKRGLYRPAIVMAWAAFMDFLEEELIANKLSELHAAYPKWCKITSAQDLREEEKDSNIIEVAAKLKFLQRDERKVLQGHLAKRNESAHPSQYRPGLNEALGYVDELLKRVGSIKNRLST
ncbi:hypothetical protein [Humidesulfovibrio sp.]